MLEGKAAVKASAYWVRRKKKKGHDFKKKKLERAGERLVFMTSQLARQRKLRKSEVKE